MLRKLGTADRGFSEQTELLVGRIELMAGAVTARNRCSRARLKLALCPTASKAALSLLHRVRGGINQTKTHSTLNHRQATSYENCCAYASPFWSWINHWYALYIFLIPFSNLIPEYLSLHYWIFTCQSTHQAWKVQRYYYLRVAFLSLVAAAADSVYETSHE